MKITVIIFFLTPLPQNGILQKEEIKDWLAILLYTLKQPTTIKELYTLNFVKMKIF